MQYGMVAGDTQAASCSHRKCYNSAETAVGVRLISSSSVPRTMFLGLEGGSNIKNFLSEKVGGRLSSSVRLNVALIAQRPILCQVKFTPRSGR